VPFSTRKVRPLGEYLCAVRVAFSLCTIAGLMRWCSLPGLCRRAVSRSTKTGQLDLDRVVAIVARVCRMRVFSASWFPRACMRRSLALYRELTRMGYPATIHFGVRRDGAELVGHSWVTVDGCPVGEARLVQSLAIAYSHSAPAIQNRRSQT
jgi:hypothetical protein